MSSLTLNRELSRQVDADAVAELGLPSLLLMENAARGAVQQLLPRCQQESQIVILAGPGNNGGDGLAIARQLAACGQEPQVVLIQAGKRLTADNEANLLFLHNCGLPVVEDPDQQTLSEILDALASRDWIIDCLLGTGVKGEPRSPFDSIIESANRAQASILAVDVPSGLDCDTGQAAGICIRATLTVTFVAQKPGYLVDTAKPYTGDVVVEHIGIPQGWIRSWYQRVSRA